MSTPKVSVCFPTCFQPNSLRLVLAAYRSQPFQDIEIVIADDGSGAETKQVIEEAREQSSFEIRHVWQENQGYRKARIMNHAVLHSRAPLLILSDGDCMPARNYIDLYHRKTPGNGFAVGGWVDLQPEYTKALTPEKVAAGDYQGQRTFKHGFDDRTQHLWNLLSRMVRKQGRPRIRGRSVAVARKVFYSINGFDENFAGFNKEDSDLRNRMINSGAKPKSLFGKSFVFHVNNVIDAHLQKHLKKREQKRSVEYYRRPDIPVVCENGLFKDGEDRESDACPRCTE